MAIIIVCGGIGSGKTLSVVKDIVTRNCLTFINFNFFHGNTKRLRYDQLFTFPKGKKFNEVKRKEMSLNYEFWNETSKKYNGFDIALDEFHNLMSSRRSMSNRNIMLSDWLSQIRKILGQSERNNLYLITQKLKRVDVNSRDLAHCFILCRKQEYPNKVNTQVYENGKIVTKMLPLVVINKYWFSSGSALEIFEATGQKTYFKMTRFVGNFFYKYFDSYELIDFGSQDFI